MPSKDPVTDELLNVYNLYAKRQRAELDLNTAKAAEQIGAKRAIPNVMAQLAEQHLKEEKRKQQIQKAQEQGQMSQAAMTPPMTDVDGQTSARRSALGGDVADAIAKKVTGGSFVKEMGNLPGASIGTAQALPQAGAQPAPVTQPGEPGSVRPVEQELSGGQRALSGLGAFMSLVGRSPQGVVEFGKEAITGKRTVGYERLPTVQEQAATFAQPLSSVRFAMDSKDPQQAGLASQQYQKHLDSIEQQFGRPTRDAAEIAGEDLYWAKAQAQALKEEEPARKRAELMFNIENKVVESGKKPEDVLNPGELALLQGRQTKGATVIAQNITPANTTEINKKIMGTDDLLNQLNSIDDVLTNPDGSFWADPFTVPGKIDYGKLAARDYLGNITDPLTPEESDRLQRYSQVDQVMASMSVQQLHSWLGATMSEGEIKLAYPMLPSLTKGPQKNEAQLRQLREDIGLSKLRYTTILQSGSQVDPRYAMSLSATKIKARELIDARITELRGKPGYTDAQAVEQVRDEFKRTYGLDVDRLKGIKH